MPSISVAKPIVPIKRSPIRNETSLGLDPLPATHAAACSSVPQGVPRVTSRLRAARLPATEGLEELFLDRLGNRLICEVADALHGGAHLLQVRPAAVAAGDVFLETPAVAR